MTRSKLKEVVEKVSLIFLYFIVHWFIVHWLCRTSRYYLAYLFDFLSGNSQLEYLTYQEVKRNKGIVYTNFSFRR